MKAESLRISWAVVAWVVLGGLLLGLAAAGQQATAPRGASLGVQVLTDPTKNLERVRAAGASQGVFVQEVLPNSPAAQSGLLPGDIIVALDGELVESGEQFVGLVRAASVGQQVVIHYLRSRVQREVRVTLADRAEVFPAGTLTIDPSKSVQLVRDEPDPRIRIAVAHQHAASGCVGYLYVDRQTIRFEVKWPEKDRGHGFEYPRNALTTARQWTLLGTELPEAELKFSGGRLKGGGTYHFFHVDPTLPENPGAPFEWQNARDWQEIVTVVRDFENQVARLRPPPSPAPPAPQMATLQIEARLPGGQAQPGGAEFYVDDEFRGSTSSEGKIKVSDLGPGEHRLRLSLKGYEEWSRTVTVEAGENRVIEAQLAEAKAPEPPPPPPETTLSLADVLKLLEGGVTPARIETIVKDRGVSFELTDDAESKLRALGATDSLLLTIAKAKK